MDYYFPSTGERHASPILLERVVAQKSGKGDLEIHFRHANYPGGVQSKVYKVRVLCRTEGLLMTVRDEPGISAPLIITELSLPWFTLNFPHMSPNCEGEELQAWCESHLN